ncbi:MAG: hypothetical protein CL908_23990 [Deltaproteobacteria bacterium]|jgi:hypothetical protein|nr:hypothetical protein [Deltaproteobacteria bacterium]
MKNILETFAYRDEAEGALGRHSGLLASLILLLVALPMVQYVAGGGGEARFPALLALVLVAAVVVNSHQRWTFIAGGVIAGASVLGSVYAEINDATTVRLVSDMLGLTLLGFTTLIMLNSLLQAMDVSMDTVIGGICVYLLIGLCFAVFFILLNDLEPGSFLRDGEAILRSKSDSSDHATALLYFSFVTLTTLGYGDTTPSGDMAQMFAVSEAVIGQLYLTILIAKLVGLYVSQRRQSPESKP